MRPSCQVERPLARHSLKVHIEMGCPSWANRMGGERSMLSWSLIFLIIAIVAAMFGFGGIAGTAAWMAKVLFIIFLIVFVASLIFGRSGPHG